MPLESVWCHSTSAGNNFTVLQNIVLGMETVSHGFLKMDNARKKVVELSERYGLTDPDALIQI